MVNKPKNIGTAAETAVVRVLNSNGFPGADRAPLHGRDDTGDIHVLPGLMLEIKGGKAAEKASMAQIDEWLAETRREGANWNADYAFLVTKRSGYGAGRAQHWWAWPSVYDLGYLAAEICDIGPDIETVHMPVRIELRYLIRLLRRAGWGDPIEHERS